MIHQYIEYHADLEVGVDTFLILIFVAHPLTLETMQVCKIGFINYVTDTDNWLDITFIYGSVAMAAVHYNFGSQHFVSKVMLVVILLCAFR